MKYHGSILEFTHARNADLMRAYRCQVAAMRHINGAELGKRIVNMPSARFWVSEERAAVVISQLLKGRPALLGMRKPKREMFEEVYRRYLDLRDKMPPGTSPHDIICAVVNSPAPKFYMAPETATETIYKIKKGYYERYRHGAADKGKREA